MDFQKSVIEKSFEKPVVVDFWAPWCGPCRVLGPTIEQLASEQSDRWELVKVNTEEEQELAMEYGIRSIPNVKMFYKGQPIAEFAGALPRTQIEQWLENTLPDGRKETLELILGRLNGDGDLSELEAFVAQHPDMKDARIALARELAVQNPERALALVEPIKMADPLHDRAEAIRALAQFMEHKADDSKVGQIMRKAQEALRQRKQEEAIQQVIEAASIDKSYQKDLPRRTAIALFQLWGNSHPLTETYRRKFDMVLY
jgi:putative thioredoxin